MHVIVLNSNIVVWADTDQKIYLVNEGCMGDWVAYLWKCGCLCPQHCWIVMNLLTMLHHHALFFQLELFPGNSLGINYSGGKVNVCIFFTLLSGLFIVAIFLWSLLDVDFCFMAFPVLLDSLVLMMILAHPASLIMLTLVTHCKLTIFLSYIIA